MTTTDEIMALIETLQRATINKHYHPTTGTIYEHLNTEAKIRSAVTAKAQEIDDLRERADYYQSQLSTYKYTADDLDKAHADGRAFERSAIEGLVRDGEQARHFARIYFGYAPGFYSNQCVHCKKHFDLSDKRARGCSECADAAIAAQEVK